MCKICILVQPNSKIFNRTHIYHYRLYNKGKIAADDKIMEKNLISAEESFVII